VKSCAWSLAHVDASTSSIRAKGETRPARGGGNSRLAEV
jgi:hypothetical protein